MTICVSLGRNMPVWGPVCQVIKTPQSNTGCIKELDYISCHVLQIIKRFIHPPQGIVIFIGLEFILASKNFIYKINFIHKFLFNLITSFKV